jgi:molybdopterin-guanine dinucleotide biosynthesis protein A
MGRDKASLQIGGEPLLRRSVERLMLALPEVLVVGPDTLVPLVPGVRVVPDLWPGLGPLGGIATALQAVQTAHIFVVACDMPFVEPALVRLMASRATQRPECDAVVLRTTRGLEQMHAVLHRRTQLQILAQLEAGDRSVHGLWTRLSICEIGEIEAAVSDPRGLSAFNANTPTDWTRALALADE